MILKWFLLGKLLLYGQAVNGRCWIVLFWERMSASSLLSLWRWQGKGGGVHSSLKHLWRLKKLTQPLPKFLFWLHLFWVRNISQFKTLRPKPWFFSFPHCKFPQRTFPFAYLSTPPPSTSYLAKNFSVALNCSYHSQSINRCQFRL